MKKLFFFAVAAGMFFVACNGGASTQTQDSTATAPTVDSVAAIVDSAATTVDSAAAVVDSAATATEAKH
jgi:hypothetical protein